MDVIVIGGGPAGLTAALFTAKNGLETAVFDIDETWLHHAHLFNYPGIGSVDGDVLLETMRDQIDQFGVERHDEEVIEVTSDEDGFVIETDADSYSATDVVLATGTNRDLAESLGCTFDGDIVAVDVSMATSIGGVYATGAMVRGDEWQAVISAGDGAAAALRILSDRKGDHFHDFDSPDTADEVLGSLVE